MDTSNMSQDELNAHNKLVADAVKLAKQEAQYRRDVSRSLEDYLKGVENVNKLKKNYLQNLKTQKKFEDELEKAQQSNNKEEIAAAKAKLAIILEQNDALKEQYRALNDALASVNKKSMVASKLGAEALKGTAKMLSNIPGMLQQGYGVIKGLGLFEMDKSIRQAGFNMGLLGKQSETLRANIKGASKETAQFGISIEDLANMQSAYSESLGRAVTLSQEGAIAMGKMAADTQLGVEGASRLTAEFDAQGLSVEKTAEYMNDAMNSAHKLGLNAQKVIKNIAGNIKLLNRYNFKGGLDGLTKMAQTAAKLGVSMEFAAGFADKLFDVEGAVDMSAQLQVMGGAWAKLADPFQLMYKARNDIQGLTEDLGKAASASAHLNSKGEIELAAMEMHKLKIIAQQTGISYDELAESGKRAFKLSKIQGQVQFNMSDEEKEFLANTAQLDKNGKAYIEIKGEKKFLGMLGSSGKEFIQAQVAAKAAQGERAKEAQTFDDALKNTIMGMKQFLLPIVEVINEKLLPKLQKFTERFDKEKWGEKIEKFATVVGELVSTVGGFILDNPIASGVIALTGFLASKAMWLANGYLLAQGFNAGATLSNAGGATGATGARGLGGMFGKGLTAVGGGSLGRGAAMAGGAGIAGTALSYITDATTEKGSGWNIAGKAGAGALQGAAMGALLGPIGAGVGALIGGLAGGLTAYYSKEDNMENIAQPINDGIIPSNKLGSDFSKGRGIIQGGKITPIDNKDDLMAMKKGGPVDNMMNGQQITTNRIEFSNITIDGEIRIVSPGQPGLVIDLMKDQSFRRDITRTIQVELEKNKVGGKNKG